MGVSPETYSYKELHLLHFLTKWYVYTFGFTMLFLIPFLLLEKTFFWAWSRWILKKKKESLIYKSTFQNKNKTCKKIAITLQLQYIQCTHETVNTTGNTVIKILIESRNEKSSQR